jgi:Putative peptidoglycan binding domain
MRRTLMICMIAALAALPLMAGAQSTSRTIDGQSTEGYLIPKDANPRQPSSEAVPAQPSFRAAPGRTPTERPTEGYLVPEGAEPHRSSLEAMPDQKLVREAQIALRDAGFYPGRIDGVMGPRTRAALREFQASQGLPQTGRLDTTTQRELLAEHIPESSGRR